MYKTNFHHRHVEVIISIVDSFNLRQETEETVDNVIFTLTKNPNDKNTMTLTSLGWETNEEVQTRIYNGSDVYEHLHKAFRFKDSV